MTFISPDLTRESTFTLKLSEGHAQALASIIHTILNADISMNEFINEELCEYEIQFATELMDELEAHHLLI